MATCEFSLRSQINLTQNKKGVHKIASSILTITLNPALDLAASVDGVCAGPKLRCSMPVIDPGGGGLNVTRAIALLGGQSHAFVALGGTVGQRLANLMTDAGHYLHVFEIIGETRQSLTITDTTSTHVQTDQFRFVFPGPTWSTDQITDLMPKLQAAAKTASIVIFSGSLPPGVPPDFVGDLCKQVSGPDKTLIIDLSGDPLRWLSQHICGLQILRMDDHEAEALAAHPLPDRADTAKFARDLVDKGIAKIVIIARGADGSIMVDRENMYHCICRVTGIRSKVGAGDSFVGGFALALHAGLDPAQALRHGTAAASAAVLTDATQLCTRKDVDRLLPSARLTRL